MGQEIGLEETGERCVKDDVGNVACSDASILHIEVRSGRLEERHTSTSRPSVNLTR